MKGAKMTPLFILGFVLVSAVRADAPVIGVQRGPGHQVLPGGRDACWSEPGDLDGNIGTSEIIAMYGLESEIANDFVLTEDVITRATWWGGQYGVSVPCVPEWPTSGFNLRFYEDAGCAPGALFAELLDVDFTEEYVGCSQGRYPVWKWSSDVAVSVAPGARYWFSAQFTDHPFPGQGGRLATLAVTDCESMLKSAYFGYPDWTPLGEIFGEAWDASQEFECGVTPAEPTSWGRIKEIYR